MWILVWRYTKKTPDHERTNYVENVECAEISSRLHLEGEHL